MKQANTTPKSPGFFTPMDIAPGEYPSEAHDHTWQLAKFVEGKPIYRTMAVGMSNLSYKVGKHPDKSLYVCDCGEKKEVTHEEPKS